MIIQSRGGGRSKTGPQILDRVAKYVGASWHVDGEVASFSVAQRFIYKSSQERSSSTETTSGDDEELAGLGYDTLEESLW